MAGMRYLAECVLVWQSAAVDQEICYLQSMRNQISTHPLLIAFIFVIMIMSGIASFFMHDRTTRSMFGQSVAVETD